MAKRKKVKDYEDLKIESLYYPEYDRWLEGKLKWLRRVNPDYCNAIEYGGAPIPIKWKFALWYADKQRKQKMYDLHKVSNMNSNEEELF